MSSNPLRLRILFEKYITNSCSKSELEEFWTLMAELSENDLITLNLKQLWNDKTDDPSSLDQIDWDSTYNRLLQKMDDNKVDYTPVIRIKRRKLIQFTVAASLIFIISGWWV